MQLNPGQQLEDDNVQPVAKRHPQKYFEFVGTTCNNKLHKIINACDRLRRILLFVIF